MSSPKELRKLRLKNDYKSMCNIRGELVTWEVLNGVEPYVESYKVTVNVKSIINSTPKYRNKHVITIELPSEYPRSSPLAVMTTSPPPFHPNWYEDGNWCHGTWNFDEGLGQFVVRLIRTLQFDPDITNPKSAANSPAKIWYMKNRNSGIFPCDKQTLPDPTKKKRTFRVHSK